MNIKILNKKISDRRLAELQEYCEKNNMFPNSSSELGTYCRCHLSKYPNDAISKQILLLKAKYKTLRLSCHKENSGRKKIPIIVLNENLEPIYRFNSIAECCKQLGKAKPFICNRLKQSIETQKSYFTHYPCVKLIFIHA